MKGWIRQLLAPYSSYGSRRNAKKPFVATRRTDSQEWLANAVYDVQLRALMTQRLREGVYKRRLFAGFHKFYFENCEQQGTGFLLFLALHFYITMSPWSPSRWSAPCTVLPTIPVRSASAKPSCWSCSRKELPSSGSADLHR